MTNKTALTRDDILDLSAYEEIREQRRAEIVAAKKLRRLAIGPYATFYFESFDTMWYQVQEMLRIEKGGEAQLSDELEAYNPLIPKGKELVATVMFEIDNPDIRSAFLAGLGGVEDCMVIEVDGQEVIANPEQDVDRTNAAGKASSVQFVHFEFSDDQIAKFKADNARVTVGINHPKYGHTTMLSEESRAALAEDFE
ncbi:MAG: DUF3501 family protein [Rhodospirillaceae bacterium]|nr:DUF3501 family protein [Rhodospirillaceae bacterium]